MLFQEQILSPDHIQRTAEVPPDIKIILKELIGSALTKKTQVYHNSS